MRETSHEKQMGSCISSQVNERPMKHTLPFLTTSVASHMLITLLGHDSSLAQGHTQAELNADVSGDDSSTES